MAFAVSKVQNIGREIAPHAHALARPNPSTHRDTSEGREKFGSLVPIYTLQRDERIHSFDYTSSPFVAQLIASRDAESPTNLQLRMLSDSTASAYEQAEALPDRLPIGLYLEQSI